MTAPTKYTSKGAVFFTSISNVATAVGAVDSIDGPDPEVEDMEITALDSAAGKEHGVTGYVEPGTVSGSLFFDPANATHKAMTALIAAPVLATGFKITWSDVAVTAWTFSGIMKKFKPSAKVGEFLKADFTVQLSGLVTGW